MAERATIFQVSQLGVESPYGTHTAANKRLLSVEIVPAIKSEVKTFRPRGIKLATLAALGKEWVEAKITGLASYNDLTYLLASLMMTPTPAQQGATAAYKSTFTIDSDAPDAVTSYSVEVGDPSTWSSGVIAHEFSGGIVTDLSLDFSRDEIKVDGTMLGKDFVNLGATMTAASEIALKPVLPTEVSVYMTDTAAGLPGSALTRVLSSSFKLSRRFNPLWVLNAATVGFVAPVEVEPDMSLTLKMEADAAGMGPLTQLRSGASKFIRIEAVGPTIASTYKYTLTLDMCGKVAEVSEFSDEDGVYALAWTFKGAHDSTWTKGINVELINTISAL